MHSLNLICHVQEETIEHALFHYHHARMTWFKGNLSYYPDLIGFRNFGLWWEKILEPDKTYKDSFIPKATIIFDWSIWNAHNRFLFQHEALNPISKKASKALEEQIQVQFGNSKSDLSKHLERLSEDPK